MVKEYEDRREDQEKQLKKVSQHSQFQFTKF